MVVRQYGKNEQKKMEKEGSKLMENGYMMMGQSGGSSTFLGDNGKTTVTYVKR
jgi:hypothetical protein